MRTALGVATITFYSVLLAAGGTDVLATTFGFSVNQAFWAFRIALLVLPALATWTTHRLCSELLARERPGGEPPRPASTSDGAATGPEIRERRPVTSTG